MCDMATEWLSAELAAADPVLHYARRVADGSVMLLDADNADWVGRRPIDGSDLDARVHDADRAALAASHRAAVSELRATDAEQGARHTVRYRWRDDHGNVTAIMESFRVVRSPDGELVRVGALRSVPLLAAAEQALATERDRLALVLDGTRLGLWDWNMQTGDTVFNERWAEIIGYRLEELEPTNIQTWIDFANPEDLAQSDELIERHASGELPYYDIECRMRHRDGSWVWVRDRGKIVEWTADGKPLRMTGTHEDVTERKRVEDRLLTEALTDELTGLANRRRLERELRDRAGGAQAVVMIDLDDFKRINDELGHAHGDNVLVAVGAAIAAAVRPDDLPVRLAGDEFVVLVATDDPRTVNAVAERIAETIARVPSGLADAPHVGASIGVAASGAHGRGPFDLLRAADRHLYDAKRAGGRQIHGG